MDNRERDIQIKFRVTPEEKKLIEQKMAQFGTVNMAAYLRKMAIDGYIVKLELPALTEMVSLLRRYSGNLNQIAKRVNSTGRIYQEDISDIQNNQERIWQAAEEILRALAVMK